MASSGSISSDLISKLSSEAESTKKKNGEIGKNEFLQMLVTQLKNQDPMNPMDGDQFAVNLAQFSQLEQLVSINDKLGGTEGSGDSSSLASYLGREVLLDTKTVGVVDGDGGLIRVDLPADATNVEVELLDEKGNSVQKVSYGELAKGEHSLGLNELSAADGEYNYKITMTTASGGTGKILGRTGGLVSGFVPGADPKLLLGSKEISPSDVKTVLAPVTTY